MMHLLLLSLVGLAFGQETPSIGFITPDVVADIGQDIKLECVIQNGEDYPVNWMKLNDRSSDDLISTGSTLAIKDPRFQLHSEEGTFTLVISDLKESDASKYQCQVAVSLTNKKTADVSIKVKLPPRISDDTPVNVQAIEGENVDLICDASGFPLPKISWKRSDESLLRNGGVEVIGNILTLKKVMRGDRGTYVCTASNGVGEDVKHSTYLEIGFVPEIRVERPRTSQALGYDVELACKISAFPAPGITWYHIVNGTEENLLINEGENYRISHFAEENGEIITKLQINGILQEQFGSYFCKAVNKFGSDVETMELYVSSLPICPPICNNFELMYYTSKGNSILKSSSVLTILIIFFSIRIYL